MKKIRIYEEAFIPFFMRTLKYKCAMVGFEYEVFATRLTVLPSARAFSFQLLFQ